MTIGIDFVLKASTANFTKGLATARNALLDTKKGLKELDVPREFQKLIGPGLFVVGLKHVIEDARHAAEEMQRLGKPIDDTTARVIEYGNTLDEVGKNVSRFGAGAVAWYQRIEEAGACDCP